MKELVLFQYIYNIYQQEPINKNEEEIDFHKQQIQRH